MEAIVTPFPLPFLQSTHLSWGGVCLPHFSPVVLGCWLPSLGSSSDQDVLLGGEKRKAGVKWAGVGRKERVRHQA